MIAVKFEEKEKIGLQYALENTARLLALRAGTHPAAAVLCAGGTRRTGGGAVQRGAGGQRRR